MSNPTPGPFKASSLPDDAVELGRILDAWGLKGWIKVQPHSAESQALYKSTQWFLLPPEERFARGFSAFAGCVSVEATEIRNHADGVVAKLDGVDDRTAAEALKGARIYVPRSAFPTPTEGEYYWVDLMGLEVVNREGEALGVVRDLLLTGPTSVLVIEYTDQQGDKPLLAERMIPFVDTYIDKVDLEARRIMVDWQADY